MGIATNSLGWHIEQYDAILGWVGIIKPSPDKEEMVETLKLLGPQPKLHPLRVYEALS